MNHKWRFYTWQHSSQSTDSPDQRSEQSSSKLSRETSMCIYLLILFALRYFLFMFTALCVKTSVTSDFRNPDTDHVLCFTLFKPLPSNKQKVVTWTAVCTRDKWVSSRSVKPVTTLVGLLSSHFETDCEELNRMPASIQINRPYNRWKFSNQRVSFSFNQMICVIDF